MEVDRKVSAKLGATTVTSAHARGKFDTFLQIRSSKMGDDSLSVRTHMTRGTRGGGNIFYCHSLLNKATKIIFSHKMR